MWNSPAFYNIYVGAGILLHLNRRTILGIGCKYPLPPLRFAPQHYFRCRGTLNLGAFLSSVLADREHQFYHL